VGVDVIRFEMSSPGDNRHLGEILQHVSAHEAERIAIVGKTEGTATINDFGRALATRAIQDALAAAKVRAEPHIILSMGSEGIISPGGYLFVDVPSRNTALPGLVLGLANSPPLTPADMMSERHIEAVRATTQRAIRDSGLTEAEVALVLCKNPLLTRDAADHLPPEQKAFGNLSWGSRGIAALGIGIALSEVDPGEVRPSIIGRRHDIFSRRAMVFSGTETNRIEILVLGNRAGAPAAIRSGQIEDIIDIDGLAKIVTDAGGLNAVRALGNADRIVASFLKANVAPDGKVRGHRTTVYSSDLDPDKHMRAVASGVLGALLGDTRFFVSGGAEHQAPPGGGIFAVIQKQQT
jgi:cyanuric acid amidohydrolase